MGIFEVFGSVFGVFFIMEGFATQKKSIRQVKSCFDRVDRLNCETFASGVWNFI
jgi:hypothetical protein